MAEDDTGKITVYANGWAAEMSLEDVLKEIVIPELDVEEIDDPDKRRDADWFGP